MIRTASLLLVLPLLGGCASTYNDYMDAQAEREAARHSRTCTAYGLIPGSPEHANCAIELARQQHLITAATKAAFHLGRR